MARCRDENLSIGRRPQILRSGCKYDESMAEEPHRPPRFLTIEQVARELNVGEPLVRAMLKSGELRGIQVGGRAAWRIGIADVEAYIEQAYQRTAGKIARGDFVESQEAAE